MTVSPITNATYRAATAARPAVALHVIVSRRKEAVDVLRLPLAVLAVI